MPQRREVFCSLSAAKASFSMVWRSQETGSLAPAGGSAAAAARGAAGGGLAMLSGRGGVPPALCWGSSKGRCGSSPYMENLKKN